MKVLGITGGVGSGKSTVLAFLQKQPGVFVLEADKVAHLLEEPGGCCYQEIVSYFGTQILDKDDIIDRKKLGILVFADKQKLQALNTIVHPQVKTYIKRQIDKKRCSGMYNLFVLEAALLLEEHYDKICDWTWYIYASKQNRSRRLQQERGYSAEKIQQIMDRQLPEEAFFHACSCVIDNNSGLEDTLKQVREELACLNS